MRGPIRVKTPLQPSPMSPALALRGRPPVSHGDTTVYEGLEAGLRLELKPGSALKPQLPFAAGLMEAGTGAKVGRAMGWGDVGRLPQAWAPWWSWVGFILQESPRQAAAWRGRQPFQQPPPWWGLRPTPEPFPPQPSPHPLP